MTSAVLSFLEDNTTKYILDKASTEESIGQYTSADYLHNANTSDLLERLHSGLELRLSIFIIIMGILLAFSISSNVLIIYCVVRLKNLRTVTNIFICNLSVSDILLAAVMPLKLYDISQYTQNWHEGKVHCKIVNVCPILLISSSIYTLVYISHERRHVIVNRVSHGHHIRYRNLMAKFALIWMFASVISLPTLFEYTVHEKDVIIQNHTGTLTSCGSNISRELEIANAILVTIVSYIIPVIVLTMNYTQIAMYVWKKGKFIRQILEANGPNSGGIRLFNQRIKLVKLLILVAAIFALSWLPFFAVLAYAKTTGQDASEDAAGVWNLILLALEAFSSAYNVILYVIFNPGFKHAIVGVLKCKETSELNDSVSVHVEPQQILEQPAENVYVGNRVCENNCQSSVEVIMMQSEFKTLGGHSK